MSQQTPREHDLADRLWSRDGSLWESNAEQAEEITQWLGWMDAPEKWKHKLDDLQTRVASILQDRAITTVVVLGMGGSSLAPSMFASFCRDRVSAMEKSGFPQVVIMDTTHPESILALENPEDCLFLVSSKSGTTVETSSLYRHFYSLLERCVDHPGQRFIAITDPDSWLAEEAENRSFRELFLNAPDIGGRFSALSYFGLLPAALAGADVASLLDGALKMSARCRQKDTDKNPGLCLGLLMSRMVSVGKNKLLIRGSRSSKPLFDWIEQLVAESLGKNGNGILPVWQDQAESFTEQPEQIEMRVSMSRVPGDTTGEDVTTFICTMDNLHAIGGEIFRWEFATAVAGLQMKINPFDQPDVEFAKQSTRQLLAGKDRDSASISRDFANFTVFRSPSGDADPASSVDCLADFYDQGRKATYAGILAFIPDDAESRVRLNRLRTALARRTGVYTVLGFGPRYLHSTGQLHKGGPAGAVFLQITEDFAPDVSVPDSGYSFNALIQAQAEGDFEVLAQRGQTVMRVHLKGDRLNALNALLDTINTA